jgi:hypothetical protein
MDEFLTCCYLGRGRAKEFSSCLPILFFFFYHDFCDYDTISAFPLSSQSVCFLAVHCKINFFETIQQWSNPGGQHAFHVRQDEAREHGMASTEGKSYITLDKICFGFYIAGFLIYCFIAPLFHNHQSAGGSLGIVIVVFTSFWHLGTGVSCSLPHARRISIPNLLFLRNKNKTIRKTVAVPLFT